MSQEPQNNFLEDFDIPTYEEWRKAAEATLNGVPFEKKLITKTYEGIDLQPIYNLSDIQTLQYLTESLPGEGSFNRSTRASGYKSNAWEVSQEISYPFPEMFNQAVKSDLDRGQTALNIRVNAEYALTGKASSAFGGLMIANIDDMGKALNGVCLESTPVYFKPNAFGFELAGIFAAYCAKNNVDLKKVKVCFGLDPLVQALHCGKAEVAPAKIMDDAAELIKWAKDNAPMAKVITIDGEVFHNAGANAVQELAYIIAAGVNAIKELMHRGVSAEDACKAIAFNFSVGARFFTEIAKVRAARAVWAKIVSEFGASAEAQKMYIMTFTSKVNKTKFDPYVNLLRGTTEALSAVLAGAESVHVSQFDEELGLPSDFSRRISRNIQSVLKHEAHLMDTIDPAGGSYYLETLTDQIAVKAWDLFRNIEKEGGLVSSLKAGTVHNQIKAVVAEREKNLAFRKDSLLGTNKYPNLIEKPVDNLTIITDAEMAAAVSNADKALGKRNKSNVEAKLKAYNSAFMSDRTKSFAALVDAANEGVTIGELLSGVSTSADSLEIAPLAQYRMGTSFEALRLSAEAFKAKTGKAPQIGLVNFGALKEFKPRMDFSTDFFSVGGFEMVASEGFATAQDAVAKMSGENFPIMVICSTDLKYPEVVPEFAKAIKAAKPNLRLVLAGLPKDYVEEFKAAGVDEFIHVKANNYEILSSLLKEIGVL